MEERIERAVAYEMDRLDKLLLNGEITQEEYEAEVASMDGWTTLLYEWFA